MRAVSRGDFPGNDGMWRASVERRLRSLMSYASQALRDVAGNILVDDDASGQGLARPYLAWSVTSNSDLETTTSATFAELFLAAAHRQHPRVSIALSAVGGASTAGEVQVVHVPTGTVIAGPTVVPAGGTIAPFYEVTLPAGVHEDWTYLAVQARRTSGASTISVRVFGIEGIES